MQRAVLGARAGLVFLKLYLLPTQPNALPEEVRLAPTW
jgi:magnesium-protoporphyrin IX monomethyl ester (oxidative) cyclase